MDGIVLEVVRDRAGFIVGLDPVDPDTIYAGAAVNGRRDGSVGYVQVIEGRPVQEFRHADLIVAKVGRIA